MTNICSSCILHNVGHGEGLPTDAGSCGNAGEACWIVGDAINNMLSTTIASWPVHNLIIIKQVSLFYWITSKLLSGSLKIMDHVWNWIFKHLRSHIIKVWINGFLCKTEPIYKYIRGTLVENYMQHGENRLFKHFVKFFISKKVFSS